jgi:hypothetical protein
MEYRYLFTIGFSKKKKKKRRNDFTAGSYLSSRRSPSALKHVCSGYDVSDTNLQLRGTETFKPDGLLPILLPYLTMTFPHHSVIPVLLDMKSLAHRTKVRQYEEF